MATGALKLTADLLQLAAANRAGRITEFAFAVAIDFWAGRRPFVILVGLAHTKKLNIAAAADNTIC